MNGGWASRISGLSSRTAVDERQHGHRRHFPRYDFSEIDAHLLQTVRHVRAFRVGAGDTKAEIDQHFGDTGHADAADADEVNVLYATEHKNQ